MPSTEPMSSLKKNIYIYINNNNNKKKVPLIIKFCTPISQVYEVLANYLHDQSLVRISKKMQQVASYFYSTKSVSLIP